MDGGNDGSGQKLFYQISQSFLSPDADLAPPARPADPFDEDVPVIGPVQTLRPI